RGIAFRGLLRDPAALAFGASIVHCNIETPKSRDGLVDHIADVVLLANVGVDELGFRTGGTQFLDEPLAGLVTPASHDHLRALLREGDGCCATDSCEGSCDQNDGAFHGTSPADWPVQTKRWQRSLVCSRCRSAWRC